MNGTGRDGRPQWILWTAICLGLIALLVVIPDLGSRSDAPPPLTAYHARIVALLGMQRPDPVRSGGGFLPDVQVVMLDGPSAGREVDAYLEAPGGAQLRPTYAVGDEVLVTVTQQPAGPPFVAISDRWRLPFLALLAGLFVVVVAGAARLQGLRALLGLALSALVVVRILVPEILNGVPPVPLAVGLALALTVVIIGLSEGLSRTGVSAILGTAGGLCLTALLSAATVAAGGFTNAEGSELVYLQTAGGTALDLRGLLLAAFVLGSLGILNDVTVTQAAVVDELSSAQGMRGASLYRSAFRVGRSHIGAAITTLFLAYAGASLPLLVLFSVTGQPPALILNGEAVSIEVVRTLVGGIGLVAAVPLSTLAATWLAGADRGAAVASPRPPTARGPALLATWIGSRPPLVLAIGLAASVVATAAGALVLGDAVVRPTAPAPTGPILAMPAPGASLPAYVVAPSSTASPSAAAASPSPPDIPVFGVHDRIDLASIGGPPVTIRVMAVRAASAGGNRPVEVELQFSSPVALTVDPATWLLLTDAGNEYSPLTAPAPTPRLRASTVGPGHPVSGWLTFAARSVDRHGFLELLDGSMNPLLAITIF